MATTVLPEGAKGEIRCKACKEAFPEHGGLKYHAGGRSGWSLLAEHINKRHPDLARELAQGLAAFDRDNSLILAEGRALCAPAKGGE